MNSQLMDYRKMCLEVANAKAARIGIDGMPLFDALIGHGKIHPYGCLEFGMRYRVRQPLKANRMGQLAVDTIMRYLGYYTFPYDNGLRLYLQTDDQVSRNLEFEGIRPDEPGVLNYLTSAETHEYFEPLPPAREPRDLELEALKQWLSEERNRLIPQRPKMR